MACTFAQPDAAMMALHDLANTVGPATFGALSILLAVIALFKDLKKDRLVIARSQYANLRAIAIILATESMAWVGVNGAVLLPLQDNGISEFAERSVFGIMLAGIFVATVLLLMVVQAASTMVAKGIAADDD